MIPKLCTRERCSLADALTEDAEEHASERSFSCVAQQRRDDSYE